MAQADTPEAKAVAESLKAYEDAIKTDKGEPTTVATDAVAEEVEVETKEPAEEAAAPQEKEAAAEPEVKEKHKGNPVDAVVALRKHNQMLSEELAMARGQVEVLSKVALAKRDDPVAAPPKKDRLAEIEQEKLALADKVDAADITFKEYEASRSKLEKEARELEYAQLTKAAPRQAPVQQEEDLYLAEKTTELAEKYPFLNDLTAADLAVFHKKALLLAEFNDEPIGTGPRETLRLRKIMVELAAEKYQPEGAKKPATNSAADEKRAALEAKLKVQEDAPPNIAKLGSGGQSGGMTDAEFQAKYLAADEQEARLLMKQMPATLKKKLGL